MTSRLIGDVSDYIENEVACILPAKVSTDSTLKDDDHDRDRQVVVNLNDCLACSGCITSAESVLVEEQSWKALKTYLSSRNEEDKPMAVTVCPSTIVALQSMMSLTKEQVWKRINHYFSNILNFSFIVDSSFGSEICLQFAKDEYDSWINENEVKVKEHKTTLFTSECPGWICYVEKRHPELIDQLSKVPSAQQTIGFLLKRGFLSLDSSCYHLAIMSCYDKKLEASRGEYSIAGVDRDVDLVISTDEFLSLLKEEKLDFSSLKECSNFTVPFGYLDFSGKSPLSQGGGYMQHLTRGAKIVKENKIRNSSDFVEYTLQLVDGSLTKMAKIYGFKNIQTFLQRSKRPSACHYAYVEIMACPGACLFGGGQPPISGVKREDWEGEWAAGGCCDMDDCVYGNGCTKTRKTIADAIDFLKENNLMKCKYNTIISQKANPIMKVQW